MPTRAGMLWRNSVTPAGRSLRNSRRKLSTKAESIRTPASTRAYGLASSTPSRLSSGEAVMDERRESQRHRTFLAGKVIFGANRFQIDCSVRDLSSGGARLSLADPLAVPSGFELHLPARRTRGRGGGRGGQGPRDRSHVPGRAAPAERRAAPPRRSCLARPPLPACGERASRRGRAASPEGARVRGYRRLCSSVDIPSPARAFARVGLSPQAR